MIPQAQHFKAAQLILMGIGRTGFFMQVWRSQLPIQAAGRQNGVPATFPTRRPCTALPQPGTAHCGCCETAMLLANLIKCSLGKEKKKKKILLCECCSRRREGAGEVWEGEGPSVGAAVGPRRTEQNHRGLQG